MAAVYATQSMWYHDTSDGLDHFVAMGAVRDTVTDAFVTSTYAALFSSSPIYPAVYGASYTVVALPPKLAAFLAGRPRGWVT